MSKASVSVLGLGLMGASFASTLAKAGYSVTAWSRTPREYAELTADGVTIAQTADEAIGAGELVIVITKNYETSKPLFAACKSLARKTIVQMTSGLPADAIEWCAEVKRLGGDYLDVAIKKGPTDIGTDRGSIFYAGPRPTFDAWQPLLSTFGGNVVYLSDNIAAAKAFDLATFARSYMWLFGYFESIAIAEQFGLKVSDVTEHIMSVIGSTFRFIERSVPEIASNEYAIAKHASVSTHYSALRKAIKGAEAEGINTPLLRVIACYMEKTIADGMGDREIAACFRAVADDRN
jgi:3-hydroxyisobutyrate dehydrogenase-like beta-hydroxyacid dehydrogenase